MKLVLESALVMMLAVAVAIVNGHLRGEAHDGQIHYGVPILTREQAECSDNPIFWVVVQTDYQPSGEGEHVIRPASWQADLDRLLEAWSPNDIVVVTGNGKARQAVRQAAERLDRAGLQSVYLLSWEDAR